LTNQKNVVELANLVLELSHCVVSAQHNYATSVAEWNDMRITDILKSTKDYDYFLTLTAQSICEDTKELCLGSDSEQLVFDAIKSNPKWYRDNLENFEIFVSENFDEKDDSDLPFIFNARENMHDRELAYFNIEKEYYSAVHELNKYTQSIIDTII